MSFSPLSNVPCVGSMFLMAIGGSDQGFIAAGRPLDIPEVNPARAQEKQVSPGSG